MEEKDKAKISFRVEAALKKAYLWDEVKDRPAENAETLSGGQQQRLCMARALAAESTVLVLSDRRLRPDTAKGRDI